MSVSTVTVVLGEGVANLQRVTTVLAHQRADVHSMVVQPGDPGQSVMRLAVTGCPAVVEQLVKRLRRTVCVLRVEVDTAREAPDPPMRAVVVHVEVDGKDLPIAPQAVTSLGCASWVSTATS